MVSLTHLERIALQLGKTMSRKIMSWRNLAVQLFMSFEPFWIICIQKDFCSWAIGLIRNKIQTAVINIVSFRIFINLTFPMLFNVHFQK